MTDIAEFLKAESDKLVNKLASTSDPVFDGPPVVGPAFPGPTVALVTMTKNGARRLQNLFKSVFGFVTKALILDTGSTDNTVEWLKANDHGFPVMVEETNFVNFELTRNMLMVFAKGQADWLLLLDDDMGLSFLPGSTPDSIRHNLDPNVGGYMMLHAGHPEYWVTRLVRGDRLWEYKGVTHEYLVGGGSGNPKLAGVSIWHHFNHGPEKFHRDLRLLAADIARDPNDVRTIFYLANTLRDIGNTAAAIRFYCMRANMGGWDEEVYNSMYEAARLAQDPEGMKKAHTFRPTRAEAAAWLSGYYRFVEPNPQQELLWESTRQAIPFPVNDVLFVIRMCYGPDFISKLEHYK